MKTHDLAVEMDKLLAEAQGFVRGHDLFGARARAQFAKSELDKHVIQASPDLGIDALRARVELELREYDRLARDWQAQNNARHAAFLTRERGAIEAPERL